MTMDIHLNASVATVPKRKQLCMIPEQIAVMVVMNHSVEFVCFLRLTIRAPTLRNPPQQIRCISRIRQFSPPSHLWDHCLHQALQSTRVVVVCFMVRLYSSSVHVTPRSRPVTFSSGMVNQAHYFLSACDWSVQMVGCHLILGWGGLGRRDTEIKVLET